MKERLDTIAKYYISEPRPEVCAFVRVVFLVLLFFLFSLRLSKAEMLGQTGMDIPLETSGDSYAGSSQIIPLLEKDPSASYRHAKKKPGNADIIELSEIRSKLEAKLDAIIEAIPNDRENLRDLINEIMNGSSLSETDERQRLAKLGISFRKISSQLKAVFELSKILPVLNAYFNRVRTLSHSGSFESDKNVVLDWIKPVFTKIFVIKSRIIELALDKRFQIDVAVLETKLSSLQRDREAESDFNSSFYVVIRELLRTLPRDVKNFIDTHAGEVKNRMIKIIHVLKILENRALLFNKTDKENGL